MATNETVAVQLAVLTLKIQMLEEKNKELEEKVEDLEKANKKIADMSARWKGGIAVLIALGSFAGFAFSYFDKFKAFFAKVGA